MAGGVRLSGQRQDFWCRLQESNPRPSDYKSAALPIELHPHWSGRQESNLRGRLCRPLPDRSATAAWEPLTGLEPALSAWKTEVHFLLHLNGIETIVGAPPGFRSPYPLIKSQLLYLLSYGPTLMPRWCGRRGSPRQGARAGQAGLMMREAKTVRGRAPIGGDVAGRIEDEPPLGEGGVGDGEALRAPRPAAP